MSETDPWKVAKSTIRARIADYSVALLGHSSGSQQAKENAQTAIDVAIDAARAAEAAQHRQEIDIAHGALLSVEQAVLGFDRAGDDPDGAIAMALIAKQEATDLRARLAAVEAERDHAQNKADVRGNMLRYIAFVTTGDENGDGQLGVDRLRVERDRLKAALQDAVYTIAGWRTGSIGSIGNVHVGSFDVEHLARLRAALTPQGQSTDGETR